MLDVVRHELLREGISLGLLTSSFSITGLNFLWSPNLLSIFFTDYSWKKRILLLSFISMCCVMTSVVGPASAILFIPTQVWLPNGWTQFYLGGTNDERWPSLLTAEHTGPKLCRDHSSMLQLVCPTGGYETISPRLRFAPEVVFDIPIHDCYYTRMIHGRSPWLRKNATEQITPEVWVQTPRADVTFMMQDLSYVYNDAQDAATGRNRRLRDFVDGSYMISASKLPVGRVVCGPPRIIQNDTNTLPFPVLAPNQKWRNLSTISPEDSWGPVIDHDVEDLHSVRVNKSKVTQASTVWVPLSPEFEAATTGLAIISQNLEMTVGRGCTLDFRWATGHVVRGSASSMGAFEAVIDEATPPSDSSNHFSRYDPADFFDPRATSNYGPTIKASKSWLDAAFPKYVVAAEPNAYNMTTLEDMIDRTTISYPDYVASNDTKRAYEQLAILE